MLANKILRSTLSSIDLFGPSIATNLLGREKSKTYFGGICSLLFFGFLSWAIYNCCKDLFSTLSPKVMVYDSYNGDPRLLTMSRDAFPIAFNVQGPLTLGYKPFIDESIYTIQVTHSLQTKTFLANGTTLTNLTTTKIYTEKCTKDYFAKQASSLTQTPLSASYCISENQPDMKNLQIQGTATSSVYQYIHAKVIQCNNATSAITCAPQEKIDSYISGGYFNAIYVNMVLNPQNYTHPNATFKDLYYTMISTSYYKEGDLKLGYVEVTTDSGLLTEEKNTQSFLKVNSVQEFMDPSPNSDRILMTFKMRVSQVETYASRSYKKLPQALAEVGGLANVVLMTLFILTTPFLRLKLRESLMNNLFEIQTISQGTRRDNKKTSLEPIKKPNSTMSPHQKSLRKSIENGSKNALGRTKNRLKTNLSACQENKISDTLHMKSQLINTLQPFRFETFGDKIKRGVSINSPDQTCPLTLDSTARYRENEEFLRKEHSEIQICESQMIAQPTQLKIKSSGHILVQEKSDVPNKKSKSLKPAMKSLHDENSLHLSFSSQSSESDTEQEESKVPQRESKSLELDTGKQEEENKAYHEIEIMEDEKEEKGAKIKYSLSTKIPSEIQDRKPSEKNSPQKINLSVWEYVCSFIYKPQYLERKLDLLTEGVKSVDKQLDILNILSKLREVDNLKALLMDPDQLLVFKNLPKPEIKEKRGEKTLKKGLLNFMKRRKMSLRKGSTTSEVKVVDSIGNIRNKTKQTKLDQRLLQMFED